MWSFIGTFFGILTFFGIGASMITHTVIQYTILVIAFFLAIHGIYRLLKQKTNKEVVKKNELFEKESGHKVLFLKKEPSKNNPDDILNELEEKNPTPNASQTIYTLKAEFANCLSEDIAAIKSPNNIHLDAHSILERKFDKQHAIYIKLRNSLDAPDKDRFNEAWQAYYGEDGEQEWNLPNEYSTLLSSQLKNTAENTKQLAVDRIEKILRLCR